MDTKLKFRVEHSTIWDGEYTGGAVMGRLTLNGVEVYRLSQRYDPGFNSLTDAEDEVDYQLAKWLASALNKLISVEATG